MEGQRQAGGSLGPVVHPGGAWPGARQPPLPRIRRLCLQRAGQPHLPEAGWQAEPRQRGKLLAIPQEGEFPEPGAECPAVPVAAGVLAVPVAECWAVPVAGVSAEPEAGCREVPVAGASAEPEAECPVVPAEEEPA